MNDINNHILIHSDLVSEDDLSDLVSAMKAAVGADAYIEKQFVITSDSPALLGALSGLFANAAQDIAPTKKPRKQKATGTKKIGPYTRSYQITGGTAPFESIGTMLRAVELSRSLVERALPLGMELAHPKKGKVIVSLNGDPDGPYVIKGVEEGSDERSTAV